MIMTEGEEVLPKERSEEYNAAQFDTWPISAATGGFHDKVFRFASS
jgi:hypothetical protein